MEHSSPEKSEKHHGFVKDDELKAKKDVVKKQILFERSYTIFKKMRAQSKVDMALMGSDKSTILYELKFGFGASYKEKITNKTSFSQIMSSRTLRGKSADVSPC